MILVKIQTMIPIAGQRMETDAQNAIIVGGTMKLRICVRKLATIVKLGSKKPENARAAILDGLSTRLQALAPYPNNLKTCLKTLREGKVRVKERGKDREKEKERINKTRGKEMASEKS